MKSLDKLAKLVELMKLLKEVLTLKFCVGTYVKIGMRPLLHYNEKYLEHEDYYEISC